MSNKLDADEKLYPIPCANCGHLGEAHCVPSEGGDCPNDGEGCECMGYAPVFGIKGEYVPGWVRCPSCMGSGNCIICYSRSGLVPTHWLKTNHSHV